MAAMDQALPSRHANFLETMMRFAPSAAALSLALAITASGSFAAERKPDARAASLIEQGRGALAAGDEQAAIDAFEAALTLDPGYTPILIELARAAQADGLPGKALAYYREAQERNPRDFVAIAGEGSALLQRGAVDKARGTLAKLESLCGSDCAESRQLAAAIAAGPPQRMAEAAPAETATVKVN